MKAKDGAGLVGGVFISYRRGDTASEAAVLHQRLVQAFGEAQVSMDSPALQPGSVSPDSIRERLASCDALVVLIGRQWLHAVDRHGRRPLDDPSDHVRLEIATALERNTMVIPVLVQGTVIPAAGDLPTELAPLVHRLALELSAIGDRHWDYDVERLINALGPAVPRLHQPQPPKLRLTEQIALPVPSIPRELPRAIADFTGRSEELATLRGLLSVGARRIDTSSKGGRPIVISAIDGMGGIGKSALAIQVAHELANAGMFPDGQLYVNLQGATPGLAPIHPLEALGRMLRALGMEPAQIPHETEEAAARFRSLAAGRRLLVMLDNAGTPDQVRPLLPGSPTSGVMITSRHVLTRLEGAHALHLDVLPESQALELLGRIAGHERIDGDAREASEVVRLCGRLPLAIRIAGARLAAQPNWTVEILAERLADATSRLAELEVGELAVRASFDVSLETLELSNDPVDRASADVFGLLSLPDGPDLGVAAAARLLDQPEPTARRLLERLVDAQLLETPRPDRYQFHDLVRLYARERAPRRHPQPERLAALMRMLQLWVATAWHTLAQFRPKDVRLSTADPRWTDGGLEFPATSAAIAWLESERANLVAAIAQAAAGVPAVLPELACQLTRALFGFFFHCGYWQDGAMVNQRLLKLTRRAGDRHGESHALNDLGVFYWLLGRFEEAIPCHQESLIIRRELGDRHGEAYSLGNLGIAYRRLGRQEEAIVCHKDSLVIDRELGDRLGEALSLGSLGLVYERLGRYKEAMACHKNSLAIDRGLRNRQGEANDLGNLGTVYERLGRYEEAMVCQKESLVIFRELGNRQGQAYSLGNLGVVYQRLGRYEEAIACQQNSLTMRRELGDRHGEALSLDKLGIAYGQLGRCQEALGCHRESLTMRRELGDRHGEASSLGNLGVVHFRQGRHNDAIGCQSESLTIFRELGDPHSEAEVLRDLGDSLQAVGRDAEAQAAWHEALTICEALQLPEAGEIRDRLAAMLSGTARAPNGREPPIGA